MSTSRPFTYNPGELIPGTEKIGDLTIGIPTNGFSSTGLDWWNGPDEDIGYVIAQIRVDMNGDPKQPTPVQGKLGNVGFFRTESKDDNLFISLSNNITGQNFTTATEAKEWLENNGYWTSYETLGIVQDGLFMELDASSYTSGTWNDKTGNGNNATINGATWLSNDGGIFDFDGINDNISIPHNSTLSLSTSIQKTIQIWVKFDALGGLNQQIPVFGKLSSSFGFDGYWGGLFSNGGVIRCVTNGTAVQRISNSISTVTTDTWYLMTFISQITSTANTTKVYINENEYITASHGNDGYNETNPLYLGWIGSGVSSLYLNGKIGACYFYNRGLNTSEISNNFNATKDRYGL